MSAMNDLIIDMQEMAVELRDPFGFDPATVKVIARTFQVPASMVADALDMQTVVDDEPFELFE